MSDDVLRTPRGKRLADMLDTLAPAGKGRRVTKPSTLLGCYQCPWVAVIPGPATRCIACSEPLAPLADVHAASARRMAEADCERAARHKTNRNTGAAAVDADPLTDLTDL